MLCNKEYYDTFFKMKDDQFDDIMIWMTETLDVFKKPLKLVNDNTTFDITQNTYDEEMEKEKEEDDVDAEYDIDSHDKELLLINNADTQVTNEMKSIQSSIWAVQGQLYDKVGSGGYSCSGISGTLNDEEFLYFISQINKKLPLGGVGVDFGSGNGGIALTMSALTKCTIVGFEVNYISLSFII